MTINVIGYPGVAQQSPRLNFAQNGAQQYITRQVTTLPLTLSPGQVFVLPAGQWMVNAGRYTLCQWYDTNSGRWRSYGNQPGQQTTISSDGVNFRIANLTGCPVAAIINNVGAGNATNGYNTVGVTISGGNSTWGTLVGGSVNTTVIFGTNNGNYSMTPIPVWTPAANQTYPFIPPTFCCNITLSNNGLNGCNVINAGAGLTGAGTLTFIQQQGDTNPGGANPTLNATLTNSGNLTALWPLTPGTGVTAVPTFTFNVGGGMAANAIMNFCVTGLVNTANAGANYGNAQTVLVLSANGQMAGTGNASLQVGTGGNANSNSTLSDYDLGFIRPRMAWLTANSNATGFVNNGNVAVQDAGFGLQAVPQMVALPCNANSNGTGASGFVQGTYTATVGGINDTSYLQPI